MKFLFFSPFQAIERHAYPEAIFAGLLKKSGHEVRYVGCDGFLGRFCVSQSGYGLRETATLKERQRICRICKRHRNALEEHVGPILKLDGHFLADWEKSIDEAASSLSPGTVYETQFQNYPVGRIAAYEFILDHKVSDFTRITDEQFKIYKIYFRNTIRVLLSFEALLKKETFDRITVYNAGYSANNMVRHIALRHGIPLCFMHGGYNFRHQTDSMYFSWKRIIECDVEFIRHFSQRYPEISVDYSKYRLPIEHFQEQLNARAITAYSAKRTRRLRELYNGLSIGDQYKKIVLLTMSSSDETHAADFSVMDFTYVKSAFKIFPGPLEWTREVIDFFRARPAFKLIIRLHPRDFPNKREGVRSLKADQYERIFKDLPENIVLDHPDHGRSIYDLYEIIDLHLPAQSTTGCESAMLGIPGIACVERLGNYPIAVLNRVPRTKSEYFSAIEKDLASVSGHSLQTIRKTLDWYLYLHTKLPVNFSSDDYWRRVMDGRFLSKVKRRLKPLIGLPRYPLNKYLSSVKMELHEADVFLKFITGNKEMADVREELDPRESNFVQYFRKYLVSLFSAFYGLDLNSYSKFTYREQDDGGFQKPAAGECVFIESAEPFEMSMKTESKKDGCLIRLPQISRVAKHLARSICQA